MRVQIKIRTQMPKRGIRQPYSTAVVVRTDNPHFPPPRIVVPIRPRPGHQADTVAATLLGLGDIPLDVQDNFFELPAEQSHATVLGAIRAAVAAKKGAA